MSRTVLKSLVPLGSSVELELPVGYRVVLVGQQDGDTYMWFEVDEPITAVETATFYVVGTGYRVPDGAVHVGSVIAPPFVWHVYKAATP